MHKRFFVAAVWLFVLMLLSPGFAFGQSPWKKLVPFKRVEADPQKSYAVTDTNGPWMIVATVFRGEQAEEKARKLALELRKKHKLEAYTHAQVFDYTQGVRGRGIDKYGNPKVMKYAQDEAIKEVAVLVGNFASVEDDRATDMLKKVKSLEPAALRESDGDDQVFGELRRAVNLKRKKGPMGNAFLASNPILPPEFFTAAGVDKLVLDMNKEVPNSLLGCPGKFTIKVATFTGSSVIDQRKIREVSQGKRMEYSLQEAAEHAHLLTNELRKLGFEAYEFHNREQSIVTVGGFNQLTSPGPTGQPVDNPEIQRLLAGFGMQVASQPGKPFMHIAGTELDRRKQQFPTCWSKLDLQPSVMPVPRRPVSAAFAR
jgi:hypothetical protein